MREDKSIARPDRTSSQLLFRRRWWASVKGKCPTVKGYLVDPKYIRDTTERERYQAELRDWWLHSLDEKSRAFLGDAWKQSCDPIAITPNRPAPDSG